MSDSPETRKRLVEDALNHLSSIKPVVKKPTTPEEELVDRTKGIVLAVRDRVRHFMQAAGMENALDNKEGLRQFVATEYIEHFRHLDKEELLFIVVMLHTELAMEHFS